MLLHACTDGSSLQLGKWRGCKEMMASREATKLSNVLVFITCVMGA